MNILQGIPLVGLDSRIASHARINHRHLIGVRQQSEFREARETEDLNIRWLVLRDQFTVQPRSGKISLFRIRTTTVRRNNSLTHSGVNLSDL